MSKLLSQIHFLKVLLKFFKSLKIKYLAKLERILCILLVYNNCKLCQKKFSAFLKLPFVIKSIANRTNHIIYTKSDLLEIDDDFSYEKVDLWILFKDCWHFVTVFYCAEPQVAVISPTLWLNLFGSDQNRIQPSYFMYRTLLPIEIRVAHTVHLSLIKNRFLTSIDTKSIDEILKEYFENRILVTKNDILTIEYDTDKYYSQTTILNFPWYLHEFPQNILYFRVVNVYSSSEVMSSQSRYCVLNKTNLKQVADSQYFKPRTINLIPNFFQEIQDMILNNVQCFINMENFKSTVEVIKPIFLLNGEAGSGKRFLIRNFAESIGFHLYQLECSYFQTMKLEQIQNELKTIFNSIRFATPCVLQINDFEMFAKNVEGNYEFRLIDLFKKEIATLFNKNSLNYPLLIFCLVNSQSLIPEMNRLFLDTFSIPFISAEQRKSTIIWLLNEKQLSHNANDIDEIAARTHGFNFSDLNGLILRAKRISNNSITKNSLIKSLDEMQANYNASVGAPKVPKVYWEDIGGLEELKAEIMRSINLPIQFKNLFSKGSFKRSGILLHGPPGTGKTLIAKAVATENNFCFLSVKGPELLNMYVGQSEQNIREIFMKARQAAPCIIFFDELDSLIPRRGNLGDSSGVMDRLSSQMLTEMDNLNDDKFVFVIGATNRLDLIDSSFLRPGRFDKVLYVGFCEDLESKVKILTALVRKFKLDKNNEIDLIEIARKCPKRVSGADLYSICSNAWMTSVRRIINENQNHNNVIVTIDDFHTAILNYSNQ